MNAQQLPDECVLRVLDYLWEEPRLHEFFERRSQHAHVYDQQRRLLFAIPSNTHIYADVPEYTTSSFPQLEELYFDDAHSTGLPREEWFAPLFDVFLSHPTRLKYLTFPIVYNTQRCTLRVTLVQSEDVDDVWQPASSVLKCLTVGSADSGLEVRELERLAGIIESMPLLSRVSLYEHAYAFVSEAAVTWARDTRDLQITNNDSGLRSGQSFRSPLAQLTTAASANSPPSTSWYLIHPLLIDG
ncbi:hypothetical protein LPJ67_001197 [Coemansia sp. RSA 1938]|nr:hypothetical protein LPJ67_001197 [Coemansia sp. RSA 1938]